MSNSRSGSTHCQARAWTKLFANVISRRKNHHWWEKELIIKKNFCLSMCSTIGTDPALGTICYPSFYIICKLVLGEIHRSRYANFFEHKIMKRSCLKVNLLESPGLFIMLYFRSIGMDCATSESCYKGSILQRWYRKMTILWSLSEWSLSYTSIVKLHGKFF